MEKASRKIFRNFGLISVGALSLLANDLQGATCGQVAGLSANNYNPYSFPVAKKEENTIRVNTNLVERPLLVQPSPVAQVEDKNDDYEVWRKRTIRKINRTVEELRRGLTNQVDFSGITNLHSKATSPAPLANPGRTEYDDKMNRVIDALDRTVSGFRDVIERLPKNYSGDARVYPQINVNPQITVSPQINIGITNLNSNAPKLEDKLSVSVTNPVSVVNTNNYTPGGNIPSVDKVRTNAVQSAFESQPKINLAQTPAPSVEYNLTRIPVPNDTVQVTNIGPRLTLDGKMSFCEFIGGKYRDSAEVEGSRYFHEGINDSGKHFGDLLTKDLVSLVTLGYAEKEESTKNDFSNPLNLGKDAGNSFLNFLKDAGRLVYSAADLALVGGVILPNLPGEYSKRSAVERPFVFAGRTGMDAIQTGVAVGNIPTLGYFDNVVGSVNRIKNSGIEGGKHLGQGVLGIPRYALELTSEDFRINFNEGYDYVGLVPLHFASHVLEGKGISHFKNEKTTDRALDREGIWPYFELGATGALMGMEINCYFDKNAKGAFGENGGVLGGGRVGGVGGRR